MNLLGAVCRATGHKKYNERKMRLFWPKERGGTIEKNQVIETNVIINTILGFFHEF
jgi:hypothetical protein